MAGTDFLPQGLLSFCDHPAHYLAGGQDLVNHPRTLPGKGQQLVSPPSPNRF
jgi:hypothetical protein